MNATQCLFKIYYKGNRAFIFPAFFLSVYTTHSFEKRRLVFCFFYFLNITSCHIFASGQWPIKTVKYIIGVFDNKVMLDNVKEVI